LHRRGSWRVGTISPKLINRLTVTLPAIPGTGAGSTLLVTRGESEYSAKFTTSVGIFDREGLGRRSVHRLRLDKHELAPNCRLHIHSFNHLEDLKSPIYPQSETIFFYEAADAQISFLTDGVGRATGLVLRHGDHEVPAHPHRPMIGAHNVVC
jgi:hypothetical protein